MSGNDNSHSTTKIATGNGIDIIGNGNVLRDKHIASAAVDAILLETGGGNVVDGTAGCGIAVRVGATGTVISACSVSNCGLGLVNFTDDAELTGTNLTDDRFADVLGLGAFKLFEGNSFLTPSHHEFLSPYR